MEMMGKNGLSLTEQKQTSEVGFHCCPKTKPYCRNENFPVNWIKGKLLPVHLNQKINEYLKELAGICGIKKNLSMHVARHTFATSVTLTNRVPIETVSKMLGHTSLRTT